METKRTITVEEVYYLEDLKNYLLGEKGNNVKVIPIYKTETVPGYDTHDADCVDVFVGIKVIYED